jgi:hypothetical protein
MDADADRKGVYDAVVDVHPLDAGKVEQTDDTSQQPQKTTTGPQASGMLTTLWRWSPAIFMASYFVFSISIYTLSPRAAVKVLWFLYLTIGTILAGTTLLEAYDGLSLLRAARKTVEKFTSAGCKAMATSESALCVRASSTLKIKCASLFCQTTATTQHLSTTSATYKTANLDLFRNSLRSSALRTRHTHTLSGMPSSDSRPTGKSTWSKAGAS